MLSLFGVNMDSSQGAPDHSSEERALQVPGRVFMAKTRKQHKEMMWPAVAEAGALLRKA